MTEKPLSGRVAVVTGASRGIGYAAAVALAAAGAHVVAVARTVGGLEELDDEIRALGGEATLVPFDLKDFAAIDRLGGAIYERWGKLDILLGNAGLLGVITPLGHLEPKVFDRRHGGQCHRQLAADPLARSAAAPVRRRPRPLPHLRRRPASAARTGASIPPRRRRSRRWCRTYAGELRQTAVTANLLDPGPLAHAHARPGPPRRGPGDRCSRRKPSPRISSACCRRTSRPTASCSASPTARPAT